jgi:hypothetical protein
VYKRDTEVNKEVTRCFPGFGYLKFYCFEWNQTFRLLPSLSIFLVWFSFFVQINKWLNKNIILQSNQLKLSFVPNGLLSCFHSLAKTSSGLVDHLSCLKRWWPNKIPFDTKYLIPSTEKWSPQLSARFLTSSFCCFGTVRPNLKFKNYDSYKNNTFFVSSLNQSIHLTVSAVISLSVLFVCNYNQYAIGVFVWETFNEMQHYKWNLDTAWRC